MKTCIKARITFCYSEIATSYCPISKIEVRFLVCKVNPSFEFTEFYLNGFRNLIHKEKDGGLTLWQFVPKKWDTIRFELPGGIIEGQIIEEPEEITLHDGNVLLVIEISAKWEGIYASLDGGLCCWGKFKYTITDEVFTSAWDKPIPPEVYIEAQNIVPDQTYTPEENREKLREAIREILFKKMFI